MKKFSYIFFSLVLMLMATAVNSYACSCSLQQGSIKKLVGKAYKDSTTVFSGEVVEIKQESGKYYITVLFKVNKSYKGKSFATLKVSTGRGGGDCGYPFKVGEKYLVYAYGKADDELGSSICSRTSLLADTEDLKILQKKKNRKS
jgi:hypothetical protein